MKLLKQFDPLLVEDVQETTFTCDHHSHNHYEIVYIHAGAGTHTFNDNQLPYRAGDLFLLSPGDHHSFAIDQPTHFTYIKFTDSYFNSKRHLAPDEFYAATPEALMKLRALKEIKIGTTEPGTSVLRQTIESIVHYSQQRDSSYSPVVFYLLLSVFALVKEVVQARSIRLADGDPNHEQLSSYIHEHIYDREKVSIPAIAAHFAIAPTYFSNFFKRSFGVAYQHYLDQYRLKLVEKRLAIGGFKMKQIAAEFGFTDVSHLAKAFKKQTGLSPTDFRKRLGEVRA